MIEETQWINYLDLVEYFTIEKCYRSGFAICGYSSKNSNVSYIIVYANNKELLYVWADIHNIHLT